MSAEALAQYVGANTDDTAFVASCWAQASALVRRHIGSTIVGAAPLTGESAGYFTFDLESSTVVPPEIVEGCTLTVASELYHRRQAPSGIAQFATPGTASPMRLARDPMASVYSVLAPWLGAGVA